MHRLARLVNNRYTFSTRNRGIHRLVLNKNHTLRTLYRVLYKSSGLHCLKEQHPLLGRYSQEMLDVLPFIWTRESNGKVGGPLGNILGEMTLSAMFFLGKRIYQISR